MTDVQEKVESSMASTLARLYRLCGPPPVLSSEDPKAYEELLAFLLECYKPKNFLAETLVRHRADEEWEISRIRRHKNLLMERRFRARRTFQAYREKTAQDKAALSKKLAEQQVADQQFAQLTLPEEGLAGVIPEVDAMLLRPAEELDHAQALEVGIVYFQHLDRLLNTAIARRDAILRDIERCEHWFEPPLTLTTIVARVHADNGQENEPQAIDVQPAEGVAPSGVSSPEVQS